MSELELYIKSYFGIMQPDELNTIGSLFQTSTLAKDEFFCETGKRCDKLSFIKSGYLRVYAMSDFKEVTQWISTKGYFVTDLSALLFETPARWNIQALSDTVLYTIYRDDYNNWKAG